MMLPLQKNLLTIADKYRTSILTGKRGYLIGSFFIFDPTKIGSWNFWLLQIGLTNGEPIQM